MNKQKYHTKCSVSHNITQYSEKNIDFRRLFRTQIVIVI